MAREPATRQPSMRSQAVSVAGSSSTSTGADQDMQQAPNSSLTESPQVRVVAEANRQSYLPLAAVVYGGGLLQAVSAAVLAGLASAVPVLYGKAEQLLKQTWQHSAD